jgi:mono/diheme cytochrome c family protein
LEVNYEASANHYHRDGVRRRGDAFFYAWTGSYNIAATAPHWAVTSSFIEILKDRSIAAHSESIQAPDLKDPQLMDATFSQYHEMCRLCHGAPQVQPEEFAKGLYPVPPDMTDGHVQEELGPDQFYWIVKHGLKMTGMPAFGPTHDEKELWGLAALAREMPRMPPEQYRQKVDAMDTQGEMGHEHAHGEDGHEKEESEHNH